MTILEEMIDCKADGTVFKRMGFKIRQQIYIL